jgi:hypothetical protein
VLLAERYQSLSLKVYGKDMACLFRTKAKVLASPHSSGDRAKVS